jgi:hypothetical protein
MTDLMQGALIAACAALIGAAIAALVTRRNTVESNRVSTANAVRADDTASENALRADVYTRALKLTNHRIAWIQRLRDEMAGLLSWGMTPFSDHVTHRALLESGARINLLMNSGDTDYEKLAELVTTLQSALTSHEKRPFADEYVKVCQRILKREWEAAKRELRNGRSDENDIKFSRNDPGA